MHAEGMACWVQRLKAGCPLTEWRRILGPDDGGNDAGPGRRGDLLTDQNTTGTVMQDEDEDEGHR